MRFNTCNPLLRTFCASTTLLSFWIWSLASVMPVGAQAIELPLGLAAGSREAQITLDGKQWTPLTSSSSPLYDGAIIRTGNGVASVFLKDGTQLEFQPRSVMGISGSRAAPVVKIAIGRVLFRLPASSKTVLMTPSVRYQVAADGLPKNLAPIKIGTSGANASDQLGEIVVNQQGGSRIGLQQGEILARPVNEPSLHIVKAGQSVSIPQVGASDPSFRALLAQALPPSGGVQTKVTPTRPVATIPVYDQSGGSVGYCAYDGSFVGSSGITRNLTAPVQAGAIPPDALTRPDVIPVFTVEQEYVGNLLGPDLIEAGPLRCGCRPIPVYDQSGKSIGYIAQDGAFVSSPGITPPLTNPPPAVKLPPDVPPDSRPVFTVNAAYVGYLLRDDNLRDNRLTEAVALCGAAPVVAGVGVGGGTGNWGGGLAVTALALAGFAAGGYFISQSEEDTVASPSGF